MALGAAYEDDAITALANSPAQPKPAPEKASVWRTLPEDIGRSATGLAMGSARALTEIAATGADVVGSLRATGIATPEERRQMQRTGAPISSYSSELGDYLRSAGGIFEPDPATASVAEQVLYGFGRGATKIVGGALAAGPVGVLAAGAEEAVTQADKLRLQGVDFNARTKAGAVQGAGLALAALPVVGQTAKATAGLYAIGGPGGFMAQQALTREILQGAGYDKIGAQFDPFDPVGLAVASLLPAGFAAYGLRQQKLQRAVDSLPDLPPRTDAVPPAEPAAPVPIPSRPSAITNAVRAYPTEAVDAARVVLLAERRAAANPGAPDNLRAMDQHEAALSRAEDQIAAGEPVQVADVAPAAPEQVKSAIGNTGRFDPTTGSLTDSPYATWADQITAAIREMQAQARPADLPMLAPYVDGIPPPAAGMVRLYRADSPTVKFSDVFNADQLGAFKRPEGMTGQRLTTDLKLAQYYRSSYGPDAVISYVDVPAAALEGRAGAAGEFFIDVQARPTDAPTTPQAANPEAAAPARGAGEPPAAAGAADAGRPAGVEAAGVTPGQAQGLTTSAVTERGLTVPLRYRLAEAGDLTTSHTNDLTAAPAFPAELQPRDRSRAASAEQISRIENAIRPELLGESVKASDGAPIVGPDAVVESGNARTIALRRAYESGKADAYRAWLADNAERFGLTRQQVEGMQQPVLVRERLGNVDRAEFARQANESAVAAMSPTEQAMSDARRITDLSGLVANEDGTINMAQSADFVRQFIGQAVAPTERGTMLQANGQLSQAGMNRLRNAVFAKAYGDADILAMLTESTDANVRNILAGMLRAAPEVAKLADLAEAGARQDADIAGPLVEAVRLFSQLRSEGRTVQQFMAQGSMFGDGLSPEIAAMLEAVSLNARAPKRIAEMIGGMVDTVNALGDSRQMGMFGDAPTGADAVAGAAERAVMDSRMAMAQEKFPSMEVMLDGMEKPMPAAEFMAAMKAEADDLAADAPLMQVAAECALLNGV